MLNYTILAVGLWLTCYALVSLLILGKPRYAWYALLLIVPAIAVPQSIARVHRRQSIETISEVRQAARPWMRVGLRCCFRWRHCCCTERFSQALNVRDLAERRVAATQPAKRTLADKLHITIPKVTRR